MVVEGAINAALYDLKTGNVFQINPKCLEIIREFEKGSNLSRFPDDQDIVQSFIKFGLISNENFEEEFNIDPDMFSTMGLHFVWYELTDRCTHKCLHCYCENRTNETRDRMSLEDWQNVHEQAIMLGARRFCLIGGEPLMFPRFKELLLYFQNYPDIGIEIYTNGVLLTQDIIDVARSQGIRFAISFYSHDPETHDAITRNNGSWLRTKNAIEMILTAGLKLRISVIQMKQNLGHYLRTYEYLKELGVKNIRSDYVRPTGNGGNANVALGWGVWKRKSKPNFSTSATSFFRARKWNSCLAGKIAIVSNGDVLPCIFARNHVTGNVLEQPLNDIIYGEKLQNIWSLTKDDIDRCNACEFCYACRDCRPLAESYSGYLMGCSPACNYNPSTGEFEIESKQEEVIYVD